MRAYVESDNPRWNGISLEIPAPFLMGREPPPDLTLCVRVDRGAGRLEVTLLRCRVLGHVGEAAFYRPDPDRAGDDEGAASVVDVTVWTGPPGGTDGGDSAAGDA